MIRNKTRGPPALNYPLIHNNKWYPNKSSRRIYKEGEDKSRGSGKTESLFPEIEYIQNSATGKGPQKRVEWVRKADMYDRTIIATLILEESFPNMCAYTSDVTQAYVQYKS